MRKALLGWMCAVAAGCGALGASPLVAQDDRADRSTAQAGPTGPSLEAQSPPSREPLTREDLRAFRAELAAESAAIEEQMRALEARQARLRGMEERVALLLGEDPPVRRAAAPTSAPAPAPAPAPVPSAAATARARVASNSAKAGASQSGGADGAVGVAPEDANTQPEIASLGRQGSAITSKGKLSAEVEWGYARADRNRALFRGVEVVESVLVGVFDINESRQDVLTQRVGLQYGLTRDLEIGIDVPLIARWDTSVLTPVASANENGDTREIDNSAEGYGLGDIELSVRKQLHAPSGFGAYVIGNLQATIPTGTGPFEVNRNEFGEALEAATGSGFWSLTPGVTAIVPSDPGVVFGSLSYTRNFASNVNALIPPVEVTRVNPGDSLAFSAGVGLALNPRLSLNFGYAHTWGFGTETTTLAEAEGAEPDTQTSRDLQIGRFLFGSTYKVDRRTSVNFALEAGLTDDATDLRAMVRIPFVF
ncbi:MAG: transporter [Pseudomonadota bacterium]